MWTTQLFLIINPSSSPSLFAYAKNSIYSKCFSFAKPSPPSLHSNKVESHPSTKGGFWVDHLVECHHLLNRGFSIWLWLQYSQNLTKRNYTMHHEFDGQLQALKWNPINEDK
jgi:hypothetical protein